MLGRRCGARGGCGLPPVLEVSYPGSGGYRVDAWGRYLDGDPAQSVLRGSRYGPLLCVLAAVFVLLGGYCAVRTRRAVSPWLRLAATTVSLAATGFLAGLTVAMWLQVTSALDSVRAEVHWQVGIGDPVRGDVDTAVGACVGFAVGALAGAVLAAILGHPAVHHRLSELRVTKSWRRVGPDLAG